MTRDEERATWGRTACHWLPPAVRDALVRSMIASQRLSGIEIPRDLAEAALIKALHEPLPDIG